MKKTAEKTQKPTEPRCSGLLLPWEDYAKIYQVSRKTAFQWHNRGYDLDDPPSVWRFIFCHETWPKTFPTANGDNGGSWNSRWLELAAKRGVILEEEE